MNIYQQLGQRPPQREQLQNHRSIPLNALDQTKRPLPTPAPSLAPVRPPHLDPDRVLPPLATPSDGAKFVPLWKRNLHTPATSVSNQQQVVQRAPLPPKKKWLTQAEMGMVSPAIIPLPIPTARTSTTTTTTTTTNTSTTTNNNVGTTVSSSGSGITASSVTGRTFNYNYNNYNHHVHQFNQPPGPGHRSTAFPAPSATTGPSYGNAVADQGKRPVQSWHTRAPASYSVHEDDEEDEDDSTSQQDGSEQDESSSAPPSPQYGILDLPNRSHRRAQSCPQPPLSTPHGDTQPRPHSKAKGRKMSYQDLGLPTPPTVLVLQAPNGRRSRDYASAYAYEYSLKCEPDRDASHGRSERKKRHGHSRREEESEEEESEETEESEEESSDSPAPPRGKKAKAKSSKGRSAKAKAKSRTKAKAKKQSSRTRKSRDDHDSDEENNSDGDSDEQQVDDESGTTSDGDHRKKGKKRSSALPKSVNKTQSMSLQFASFGISDNHSTTSRRSHQNYTQHRMSRSEDLSRQSQSTTPVHAHGTPVNNMDNRWPTDLPRLPRTPGTPATSSAAVPSRYSSPGKRESGYFDYRPNGSQPTQPPYSQPAPRSQRPPCISSSTPATSSSLGSSSMYAHSSTVAPSYVSSPDKARERERERRYMNLDDPPPPSLRRTPSPAISSPSFPSIQSVSSPAEAYQQIRARVQQNQAQTRAQAQTQAQPQTQTQIQPQSHLRYAQPPAALPEPPTAPQPPYCQYQQLPAYSSPAQNLYHNLAPASNNYSARSSRSLDGPGYGATPIPPPVAQAPVSVPGSAGTNPNSPTRKRQLPPQPAQGRERAEEILKEVNQRKSLMFNTPRQQHPTSQPVVSPPSLPPQYQRQPLPQPHHQPPPPVQRQPLPKPQSRPQPAQPQRQPLPQQPCHPPPKPQPPQRQSQTSASRSAAPHQQLPFPQAQHHVYRPSSMPIESPAPVGGRDKFADIPRMGKAASVVSSGHENGTASESDSETLQGGNGKSIHADIPGIVIDNASDKPQRTGTGTPASATASTSSPQMPLIRVQPERQEDGANNNSNAVVPRVQVFESPGNSYIGPDNRADHGGGSEPPSISVSGPEDSQIFQSAPQEQQQQWGKSTPDQTSPNVNGNPVVRRNQGGLSCGGCGGPIIGRIVNAMGTRWHPGCFRCCVCDTLLEHVSSYEHEGRPYCHLDYHENFAPRCYHCQTAIIEERFISLDDPALGKRTYHEQHFFCAECGDPFLAPSSTALDGEEKRTGELALSGDGEFESDDVGFTVYRGHPYCESCHVRLRLPKCKRCKKGIRDRDRAVEALGGKWCWACFVCESCQKPFEDPAFFQRGDKPYCEPCFSIMLRNEV